MAHSTGKSGSNIATKGGSDLTKVVLDSSATIAWFMPDEKTSQELLEHVATDGAVVPSIWPLEIGNALLLAVRRGRITATHRTGSASKNMRAS